MNAATAKSLLADLIAATGIVPHGLIITSGRRIEIINATARDIVNTGDGLLISGSMVHASQATADHELQTLITGASHTDSHHTKHGHYVICPSPSERRPYIVRVLPLSTDNASHPPRVALTIIDPTRDLQPPKALLRSIFKLSEAQSQVALRILEGQDLKAIAHNQGLSMATVRTHVQHIFQKTGTHRQAELIRILSSLAF